MSVGIQRLELELEREIQACDVRLGFAPSFDDGRNADWLRDLRQRRSLAADQLAELKAGRVEGAPQKAA